MVTLHHKVFRINGDEKIVVDNIPEALYYNAKGGMVDFYMHIDGAEYKFRSIPVNRIVSIEVAIKKT